MTRATARSEEMLPDRIRFGLDVDQWTAFQAALEAPPRPLPQLGRLLTEFSLFERTIEK